jgi:hypothetical protein
MVYFFHAQGRARHGWDEIILVTPLTARIIPLPFQKKASLFRFHIVNVVGKLS